MKTSAVFLAKSLMKSIIRQTEKEVTIKAPWGNIKALTWGNPSNPPVLLCHGRLDACTSFRPLAALLPDTFFYVTVDLPGNGRSDHLPKGARYTILDFVPTIQKIKDYFKWNNFAYIGHSLGVIISKYYDIAYPGDILRSVELDPMPAYFTFSPDELSNWYKFSYELFYSEERYPKLNGSLETAPKYTYEQILELTMKSRGLSREPAEQILERSLVPAGDGLYWLVYDQRMKVLAMLPHSPEQLQKIYTSLTTPTFCILATETLKTGHYDKVPFVKDVTLWPNKNYRVKIVDGGHDVHVERPECIAKDISEFLLEKI
ncbi:serine hydrolase-like protein [Galleria mellonella]|uniref:Serine hydrolase-like protein n=1 Tax=Galleria mellonella TaxID=7137 RepID=A0A6J1WS19_GALME|nr:serine hydrolase-like protein [Galleria mellonella]